MEKPLYSNLVGCIVAWRVWDIYLYIVNGKEGSRGCILLTGSIMLSLIYNRKILVACEFAIDSDRKERRGQRARGEIKWMHE